MHSQLARRFQSVRRQRGLSLSQLARLVGYGNVQKGRNRIQRFEQRGEIHSNLLRKLADALGINTATIDTLVEQDRREFVRVWNQWADQPIRPYLVIRLLAAAYARRELSDGIKSIDEAEAFAAETARRWNKRACLTWSRRLSVWFGREGNVEGRTEAVPGETNISHMRLKGSQRSFLLENPETGRTVLRLIDWPEYPISTRPVSSTANQKE